MNTKAQAYRKKREELMNKWEQECRDWISSENVTPIMTKFFKDGIIDPETWFENDFRPLFILKEAHDAEQDNQCIDFVAMQNGKEYDIWERKGMWRALGTLAKGIIISINNKGTFPSYEELYQEDLNEYHKTLRSIAIVNIKKLSGGGRADSIASLQTKHFSCHAFKFKENLRKQIEQIQPTVIVFCGADIAACFDSKDNKLYGVPTVSGLHPSTNPNCRRKAFYSDTIEKVYNALS